MQLMQRMQRMAPVAAAAAPHLQLLPCSQRRTRAWAAACCVTPAWWLHECIINGMHACAALSLQMLDYNVPGGKLNRGMAVYDVLAAIKGEDVRFIFI